MLTTRLLRRYLRHVTVLTAAFCLVLYVTFHALQGDRGLLRLFQTQKQLEMAQGRLAALQAERLDLEQRVSLLHEESLDLDLLDQRARELLHLNKPGEVILYIR
mgnify:CR=1 FL=1